MYQPNIYIIIKYLCFYVISTLYGYVFMVYLFHVYVNICSYFIYMCGEAAWGLGASGSSLGDGRMRQQWESVFESSREPPQSFECNRPLKITSCVSK